MEEEVEVDIVEVGGDAYMSRNELEISCISSGQILSCDYTVHPQWLADNADATVHWPGHFPKQSSQDEMEMVQDEVVIEEPAPIDFNWCEEVSNCGGDIILEQDIPATQEEEVFTNSGTEAEDDAGGCGSSGRSVMSPPPVPKTLMPMTQSVLLQQQQQLQRVRTISHTAQNPRSLLKPIERRPPSKFRQTLLVTRSILKPPSATNSSGGEPLGGTVIPSPIVKRILQAAAAKVAPITSIQSVASTNLTSTILITTKPSQPPQKPSAIAATSAPSTSATATAPVYRKMPTTIRTVPGSAPAVTLRPTTAVVGLGSRHIRDVPKFRQTIKVPKSDVFQNNKRMRQLSKELRMRTQGSGRKGTAEPAEIAQPESGSKRGGKGGKTSSNNSSGGGKRSGKKFVSLHGENITINHDAESSGHTMDAQIQREVPPQLRPQRQSTNYASQSDSDDVDIDIESDSSTPPSPQETLHSAEQSESSFGGGVRPPDRTAVVHVELNSHQQHHIGQQTIRCQPSNTDQKQGVQTLQQPYTNPTYQSMPPATTTTSTMHVHPPELQAALNSLGIPDAAIDIDQTRVSALEKYFHHEFFENRPTKTPERFMKIRNFIIKTWHDARPTYVSKTAVRQGLKHCGDVNCISRIHSLLEQIGAINFGCEQLQYVRPLRELSEIFAQPTRSKMLQQQHGGGGGFGGNGMANDGSQLLPERRQRIVKAASTGSDGPEVDANYTVSHDDGRILLPRMTEQPQRLSDSSEDDGDADPASADEPNKRPTRHKKQVAVRPEFQLIECMRFNRRDRLAPFRVSITMSTLMCLQLHSLSARHEVMGFLGGHRERSAADGLVTLRLNRYKPCETSAQSGTMCEMCPVSQVQQSANLIADGYDILGWFHSHPAFPPNPSRTDVATQANMQLQFSFDQNRPFIGFILGCVDMKFKCVYVLPADVLNVNERTVPFELDVEIVKDCSNFSREIADVFDVIKANCDDYSLVLKKFTSYAKIFLQRHGYGKDVLAGLNNIMA